MKFTVHCVQSDIPWLAQPSGRTEFPRCRFRHSAPLVLIYPFLSTFCCMRMIICSVLFSADIYSTEIC